MYSIFLFGSKFLYHLQEYFDESVFLMNKMLNISPICEKYFDKKEKCYKYFLEEIDKKWKMDTPDYLILDFRTIQITDYEKHAEKKRIKNLDLFINVVSKYFSDQQVILIRTHVPKFYVIDTQLRKNKKRKGEIETLKIVKKAEKYFLTKIEAFSIDLTQFYFYKKPTGSIVDTCIYEQECYQDLAQILTGYFFQRLKGGNDKPNFSLSLQRYCKYYDATTFFSAFSVFLDANDLLESFVLSSPKSIIEKYRKELVSIYEIYSSSNHMDKLAVDSELIQLIKAYEAVRLGNYFDINIDYKLLFHNEIIPRDFLTKVKKYYKENSKKTNEKQINTHNVGYYFALLQGYSYDDARFFCKEGTIIEPVLIDIFGSCIARTCFRERFTQNDFLAVNNYWFHVPVYENLDCAIDYPSQIFDRELDVRDKNVKLQFDHSIKEDIQNSDSEWLIVDLYSFICPYTYEYKDLVYTDYCQTISRELKAKHVNIVFDHTILGNWDEILKLTIPWCRAVQKKYGKRIIMLDVNCSPYTIGDDNVIYEVRNVIRSERKNKFLSKAFDFISSHINCYCIKMACNFLPDDRGYMSRGAVHYSLDYYKTVYKIINFIIKYMPEQKQFNSYSNELRIKMIRQLLPHNNKAFLRKLFPNTVDGLVLQLSPDIIDAYCTQIKMWYDLDIKNIQDIIELYKNEIGMDDLKLAISNLSLDENLCYDTSIVLPNEYSG